MLYVFTIFDQHHDSRPLISGIYDPTQQQTQFYPYYLKGSGRSIYEAEQNMDVVSARLSGADSLMLNDAKQHFGAFKPALRTRKVFDPNMNQIPPGTPQECERSIKCILDRMGTIKPQYWQILRTDASMVYDYMQRRGVLFGYKLMHPIWSLDTYSGRSKTNDFNIQGLGREPLANPNGDPVYLHFDWVAADLRAISILSKDPKLAASFIESDPYQYMIDNMNSGVQDDKKLTRDEGKFLLLSGINALDDTNPVLSFYPGLKSWISTAKAKIASSGCLDSILGRRFCCERERSERSVFNATIQGSVAHAMQACLKKVWDRFPDNILSETHDSLVMTCTRDPNRIREMISTVSRIMVQPFAGILTSNPQFPVVVSVGTGYKNWRRLKRYNSYGDIR